MIHYLWERPLGGPVLPAAAAAVAAAVAAGVKDWPTVEPSRGDKGVVATSVLLAFSMELLSSMILVSEANE